MTLNERDLICKEIGLSPAEVVSRREDKDFAQEKSMLNISWMPKRAQMLLAEVNDILKEESENTKTKRKDKSSGSKKRVR